MSEDEFERDLYIIRRRIEKAAIAAQIPELYLCSLSCRSIIYKGMFLAESLTDFYPDLLDERFVSRFAIYHQRYSTNTFPTWRLAQPFRMLAHNGEINTVAGNINWMKSHETRLAAEGLDDFLDDVKPVVQAGGSDTASLGQRVRAAGARRPRRADGQGADDPALDRQRRDHAEGASRPVPVLQRGDGAVGRAGGDRRDRRPLGDRRARPQRAAPAALHGHHATTC